MQAGNNLYQDLYNIVRYLLLERVLTIDGWAIN